MLLPVLFPCEQEKQGAAKWASSSPSKGMTQQLAPNTAEVWQSHHYIAGATQGARNFRVSVTEVGKDAGT